MKREIDVSKIPRRGFIGKAEVSTIFGCSYQTLARRVAQGIIDLPQPMCRRFPAGVYGPTTPLKWPAEEVWTAYKKLARGVRNVGMEATA